MIRKILFITPFPPPITGNTLASKVLFEELQKRDFSLDKINMGYGYFLTDKKVFKIFKSIWKFFSVYKIPFNTYIYMTPGQTFKGLIRYSPFILLSYFFHKQLIIHIHGNYLGQEYENLKGIKKKMFKYLISRANKGIVLSKSLRRNLEPFLPASRIYELPNFVEDYLFSINMEKKLEQNFEELRIIYLSNLMKEKGILDLLEALSILRKENIQFKAKIAGHIDQALRGNIENYLNDLKDNVEYLGVVYGEQKKKLLEWGNVFIFPTFYKIEGQPISILEAMATGNVILTTKHGGIPDIFKEGINGFYIEKQNPKNIVNKLKFLLQNKNLCKEIMEHNMNEAKEKYRVKTFVENFVRILED